ncbi:hypothetical protein PPSIR1_32372 [Plesiocystis pacifica SIR-1]|uniref:Uncharacterized protein n=2 Tax=Plesiocystis pacifica TaxID=191768 RepID=A6G5L0_9BACT|nr:hypothetical protein PPSIR1_32372 [Plesiocystis pacifica SIR-1]
MPNDDTSDGTLGRIALKRMSRAEIEARNREQTAQRRAASSSNASGSPGASSSSSSASQAGRLVPYLDLFSRLSDEELGRLARVTKPVVEGLRAQVDEVNRALGRYVDLLPRLADDELIRLTGASAKTIRFWRLCQPRGAAAAPSQPSPQPSPQPAAPVPKTPNVGTGPLASASASDSQRRIAEPLSPTPPVSSPPTQKPREADPFEISVEDDDGPASAPTLWDEPQPDESSTMIIDFD